MQTANNLQTLTFALPLTIETKAYFVKAFVRESRNGHFAINSDMHYDAVYELENEKFSTAQEASKALTDLGFFEVKNGFDGRDINDLREIKSQLSEEWVSNYNLWADYQG